jgi:hypothetical protein
MQGKGARKIRRYIIRIDGAVTYAPTLQLDIAYKLSSGSDSILRDESAPVIEISADSVRVSHSLLSSGATITLLDET